MPRHQTHARKEPRRIKSIEVGFRLIRALERVEGFLPLKEIAAAANMPASKAYLYLVSFSREKLVAQDPVTGHYGLGPFATQLGLSAIRQLDVVGLARDEVPKLRDATQYAAYLSIWGDRGPTIALKADGTQQGSMAVRVGYVLPLLHTATGRVFLAYGPSKETDMLSASEAAVRGKTLQRPRPRSPAALIAEVRNKGYASTDEQLINQGFAAHSAPIFDFGGQLAAGLTVLGPRSMDTGRYRERIIGELLAAAMRISLKLGYRPPAASPKAHAGGRSRNRKTFPKTTSRNIVSED